MNYVYILNNFEIGRKFLSAEQILDILLNRKYWVYNINTPNFKKFSAGDEVIVYMAGIGRRNFVASFDIADSIVEQNLNPLMEGEKMLFGMFGYMAPIKNINIFPKPVSIAQVKEDLDFISDKKNYGLFLRQATKRITKSDYSKIIEASK